MPETQLISNETHSSPPAKFTIGQLVATPNALRHLEHTDIQSALRRHVAGDWGELCKDDQKQNEFALKYEMRLLSVYHSAKGVRFYVITESDRSVTTVLLPEDY